MLAFIKRNNLYSIDIVHDERDAPTARRSPTGWRYVTNEQRLAINLQSFTPSTACRAKRGQPTRTPIALNRVILTTFFGFCGYAPAMACLPTTTKQPHREHEPDARNPTWEIFCLDHGIRPDGTMPQLKTDAAYGMVTKLLDRKFWVHDPKSMAAVRKEGEALVQAGIWDESSVIP